MNNDQVITDIKVVGVEKPQKGKFQQHFEYVIRVTYSDGHDHFIFRRYSMLFDFHSVLKEVVKVKYGNVVVLPELPVARFQHAGRKFLRLGMNKELKQMTDFCQNLIKLPNFISEKDFILKFFDQLGTDVAHAEMYKEQSQKGELAKEQGDIPISPSTNDVSGIPDPSQDNENQYKSIAEFEASGTGELSVTCDEIVTVIEKNSSGWWLVANTKGVTGFTPATFLQPVEEKTDQGEEWVEVNGPNNMYTAVSDYEAQCPDEISFQCGEELEVSARSNFGWWRVRRRNEVGLCPASSLTIKKAPESSDYDFEEDPMCEFRHSVLKKLSNRGAPPRTDSQKSAERRFSEQALSGDLYGNLQSSNEPEEDPEQQRQISAKYTKIIPKHLRSKETNNNNDQINYVNVPVIKDGVPHYHNLQGEEAEAVNVYVVRKDYDSNGLLLKEGEMVQVIEVMPDGYQWKVATMIAPYKDGLIPADLLCPELPGELDKPSAPTGKGIIYMDSTKDNNKKPVKVMPRFTQPLTVKKPKPKPRTTTPNSPTVAPKGVLVVALVDYNPTQNELLAFSKGDLARLLKKVEGGWWFIELKGTEGWVPSVYWAERDGNDRKLPNKIPVPKVFDKSQWFYGKMARQQCEDLFEKSGQHLDFIVRESKQRVGSYVLSIKFNDKIHHFPIEKTPPGKFVVGKLSFDDLSEIVSHYTMHPLFYTDFHQPVSVGKPLSRT